jgi:hypothetical protein
MTKKPPQPSEKIVDLYDGDVRISYDDANHSYVRALKFPDGTYTDWQPTHGITAPLSMIPKAFLMPWAAKLSVYAALEWAVKNPGMGDEVLAMLDDVAKEKDKKERWPFTKRYGKWLTPIKTSYRKKSQAGKDAGHWLHTAIEIFYNSNRKVLPLITPEVAGMWKSFTEFDNFWKPDVEQTEFFVYSKLFGYSGQGDVKGYISGKKVIGDWKTTNRSEFNPDGIDIDNFYQLGGLSQAEFERTGEWPDDVFIANLDKEGGDPRVVWASEFGMSPLDAAKAYIGVHNTYHLHEQWDYKFSKKI